MKLYYSPGACSLSPHIVLSEAGIEFTLDKVDHKTKMTESGENYLDVNPKGYVPALRLDDGTVLTEGVAIVQYLADQKPATGLAPACGSMERYHLYEWLNYVSAELHKNFGPLFRNPSEDVKKATIEKLEKRLSYVETALAGKSYLMGEVFTVADAYAFAVIRWSHKNDVPLTPNITEYMKRIALRPKVAEVLAAEGLTYPPVA